MSSSFLWNTSGELLLCMRTQVFTWTWYPHIRAKHQNMHCVKSVRIRSYSGPYFPAVELIKIHCISPYSVRMRENTDKNNSEYGHFSRSYADFWWRHFLRKIVHWNRNPSYSRIYPYAGNIMTSWNLVILCIIDSRISQRKCFLARVDLAKLKIRCQKPAALMFLCCCCHDSLIYFCVWCNFVLFHVYIFK